MRATTNDLETLDRRLYLCRRRIEKRVREASIQDFYVCSLSSRSLIYKGMFLAEQLSNFYPDLKDERFVSAFAIFHQRYSTNTFPTWRLAQPFRMLAHNGEINTLKGNVNWMKNHEFKMASELFGAAGEDIKPIIQPGSSDSAALDAVFEVLVRAGRAAPLAKTILVPEAWSKKASTMPGSASRDVCLRQRRDGAVGRPGGARRHRRALGDRRHGPQRTAPAALCRDERRPCCSSARKPAWSCSTKRKSCARAASGPGR